MKRLKGRQEPFLTLSKNSSIWGRKLKAQKEFFATDDKYLKIL